MLPHEKSVEVFESEFFFFFIRLVVLPRRVYSVFPSLAAYDILRERLVDKNIVENICTSWYYSDQRL